MKVSELIKLHKKQDPNATVVWQAHDYGPEDMDSIDFVVGSDSEALQERCNGPVVVIS